MGTRSSVEKFVRDKVASRVTEVKCLSVIAKIHPQAAYEAFTHGQSSKWNFLMYTIPDIEAEFQPLEDAIRHQFLPAITGRQALSNAERELMALSVCLGGLGIPIPTRSAPSQFRSSLRISDPLVSLITEQSPTILDTPEPPKRQQKLQCELTIGLQHRNRPKHWGHNCLNHSNSEWTRQVRRVLLAGWLPYILIQEFGFCLHKQAFRDALCVRYEWQLERLPSHCACSEALSLNHTLSCSKGAMPSIWHNRIRDLLAWYLTEVCPNVAIELALQPLSGETFTLRSAKVDDGARLDLKAQNFWVNTRSSAFFYVKVYNSHAPSNCKTLTAASYRRHELEKRRAYKKRIFEADHGFFTLIVLSTSGGWDPSATVAFRRLVGLLSDKLSQPYSRTLGLLCCKAAFSLLESTIMCLRETRLSFYNPAVVVGAHDQPLDLIASEARLSNWHWFADITVCQHNYHNYLCPPVFYLTSALCCLLCIMNHTCYLW